MNGKVRISIFLSIACFNHQVSAQDMNSIETKTSQETNSAYFASKKPHEPVIQCYALGPLASQDRAISLVNELRSNANSVSMRESKYLEIRDYLVVSKQQKDKASLIELKERYEGAGVRNLYVMGEGKTNLSLRISLGAFGKSANAEAYTKRLRKMGFELETVAREFEQKNFYIDLSVNSSSQDSINMNAIAKLFDVKTSLAPYSCKSEAFDQLSQNVSFQ